MSDMAKPASIMLVEDDTALADLTGGYLEHFGYSVAVEGDGRVAIERILNEKPDLVILDVMLPGADGMEVCRAVRHAFRNPILMLTARTDQVDQIVGLELGADDYVCKPVEPRLLVARVKALLRRSWENRVQEAAGSDAGETAVNTLNFDQLSIDNGARRVTVSGLEIELTTPEYDLLWLLASNAGCILSREEIFEATRGFCYDGQSRTVDINISRVRSKIHDDPNNPKRIKTIRNKGYLFVV